VPRRNPFSGPGHRPPAKVNTGNEGRGPLLLIMDGQGHTVPKAITNSTLRQYRHPGAVTELEEFADRGHSLTIDSCWRLGGLDMDATGALLDAHAPGRAPVLCEWLLREAAGGCVGKPGRQPAGSAGTDLLIAAPSRAEARFC
jgi:hypothetical protein